MFILVWRSEYSSGEGKCIRTLYRNGRNGKLEDSHYVAKLPESE
jgi:hypothetical protein